MAFWNPQANEIFLDAIEIADIAERERFVERMCDGDEELIREVRALLEAHFQKDSLLSGASTRTEHHSSLSDPATDPTFISGTADPAASALPRSGIGSEIGPYRLTKVLGQGGMGTVYLAEQVAPVRRQVALKLIRTGADTRDVVARFESERQVLAMMDHPNIARVLDAGTHAGLPYFVMEMVNGLPITRYCEQHRLTIRRRLQLFSDVLLAVQHAHRKGIIHRDLKPSNILVTESDGVPIVKVIDFGLAKALSQTDQLEQQLTIVGGILGTPEYMSPEQARGAAADIDTRTDIYSLGVILYELLAGSTPLTRARLKSTVLQDVLRIIQQEEPPSPSDRLRDSSDNLLSLSQARQVESPSALIRMVRGEPDWMALKALEKDCQRRYESVQHFLEDVQNHLADRPISAGPVSRTYRVQKFLRRYKVLVAALSAVLAAMLIGLIGTTWGLVRARIAEQAAVASELSENVQRRQAEAALKGQHKALREQSRTLSDMYVDRGWAAARDGDPSLAALWFCEAAHLVPDDPARVNAGLLRARNMMSDMATPVAVLQVKGEPRMMEFNSDGDLLAVKADSQFVICDWKTQQPLTWTTTDSVSEGTRRFVWLPGGRQICLADSNGLISVHDVRTGTAEFAVQLSEVPSCLTVTHSGDRIAVGVGNGVLVRGLGSDDKQELLLPHAGPVRWIEWDAEDQYLATIDATRQLRIFTPETGDGPLLVRPDQANLVDPAWSPMATVLYTVETRGAQSTLVEISGDERFGRPVREALLQLRLHREISVHPDGKQLVVAGYLGVEHLALGSAEGQTEVTGPSEVFEFPNEVWSARFVGATPGWIAAGRSASARLQLKGLDGQKVSISLPHAGLVNQSTATEDGQFVATAQGDGLVRVWRPNWAGVKIDSRQSFGRAPRISSTGRFVTPGEWHERSFGPARHSVKSTQIWDTSTGTWISAPQSLAGYLVDSEVLSDDESWAVLHVDSGVSYLSVVSLTTGLPVFPQIRSEVELLSLAVSSATSMIAVLDSTGEVSAFDSVTGSPVWKRRIPYWDHPSVISDASCLKFAPDGRVLVVVVGKNPGAVHVLNPENGDSKFERIAPTSSSGHCRSIEFSPDSQVLATVSNGENHVRFWDLDSGKECGAVCHHPGDFIGLFSARFSADGTRILTSHADGFCRQFDWKTGQQVAATLAHSDEVFDAVYLQDDRFIFTICRDGNCYVWDGASGSSISGPISIGSTRQNTFPIAFQVMSREAECMVTNVEGKAYLMDLDRLCQVPETTVAAQLPMCEVLSGRRLSEGYVTGMLTPEWLDAWQKAEREIPVGFRSSAVERVESLLRLVSVAKDMGNLERYNESLRDLLHQCSELPLDNVRSFQLHALVLRFLGRSHADVVDYPTLIAERTRLISAWYQHFSGHKDAVILQSMAADAWLACEDLFHETADVESAVADNGTVLTVDESGEIRASGPTVDNDTYHVTLSAPGGAVRSLRIEVFPDSSLPKGGSGRDKIGNFFLSGIQAECIRADGTGIVSDVVSVQADFDAVKSTSEYLTDDNVNSGWVVNGKQDLPHRLVVGLASSDQSDSGQRCRVTLPFLSSYPQATMGRFRVMTSGSPYAVLLDLVRHENRPNTVTPDVILMTYHLLNEDAEAAVKHFEALVAEPREPVTSRSELPFLLAALAYHNVGDLETATAVLNSGLNILANSEPTDLTDTAACQALNAVLGTSLHQNCHQIRSARAAAELERLSLRIKQNPRDVDTFLKRADWYAQRQAWDECAQDRLSAHSVVPNESLTWIKLAPILLKVGRTAEFQQFRKTVTHQIQLVPADRTAQRLERYIKSYCAAPLEDGHPELPINEMLEQLNAENTPGYMPMYAYATAALAAYRESRFEQAVEWSQTAEKAATLGDIKAMALVVEALSLYALGRNAEAEKALQRGEKLIPTSAPPDLSLPMTERRMTASSYVAHDRVLVELLRDEAEVAAAGAKSSGPQTKKPGGDRDAD